MAHKWHFLSQLIFLYALVLALNAAKDVHYTHFFKTKDSSRDKSSEGKHITNDSNTFLNFRSKYNILDTDRERQIQMDIGSANPHREKLIPLMDQRVKNEEHVNNAMIAGVLLRKTNYAHGQSLLMYANQERLKAQATQRQMNEIQSKGQNKSHLENTKKTKQTEPDKDGGISANVGQSSKRKFNEVMRSRRREHMMRQERNVQPRLNQN
ncbi:uncharacterized protein FA14DRAFT_153867 [Meira miltonrushii]|uniref:Uncharacterized protein n=1 Tax=Meira miltonrushii TaxID=1280837 RepID=A0A316VQ44_9BASI|nr:uncharacterized protein FA14DRAFT_153867 [Meira miltonrushii]PWN38543.1 hypothetical protein FA14DRAFT_153867 [Meira miltonrushii]